MLGASDLTEDCIQIERSVLCCTFRGDSLGSYSSAGIVDELSDGWELDETSTDRVRGLLLQNKQELRVF